MRTSVTTSVCAGAGGSAGERKNGTRYVMFLPGEPKKFTAGAPSTLYVDCGALRGEPASIVPKTATEVPGGGLGVCGDNVWGGAYR